MSYNKLKEKIKGPVFPIVTPFDKKHGVDYDQIRRYIDFLYDGGARIFHVMIHTSRFGLLLVEEMKKINETVSRHIKVNFPDAVVIAADPISGPTTLSCEFAKHAQDSGADLIGVYFSERYYDDAQVFGFFETVAGSCEIGILIHEQQLTTIHGANLMMYPVNLLDKIADIDNVIAIKEDAKEDEYTQRVVDCLKDRLSIIVSGGSKEQFMQFAPAGCQAYLVGVGSFYPEISLRFYDHYIAGNMDGCWEIINDYERPFFQVSKKLGWHIGLKAAMDHLGILDARERPPLQPLNAGGYAEIAEVTDRLFRQSMPNKRVAEVAG